MQTVSEWWMWPGFVAFILTMLSVDIFLLGGRKIHRVTTKEALSWVIVWVTLALCFNFFLWQYLTVTVGPVIANEKSLEFLAGYLIEESLSVDNMFVFIMIFSYFAVPAEFQRRVLLYGVLGAIVMRLLMILFGVFLVAQFHWVLYLFGLFLVVTGIKMLFQSDEKTDLKESRFLKWLQRHLRITKEFQREKFVVIQANKFYVTPLFVVLVLIEISDLIFALDSIPAIFAITADPFIIFTSNIFAILGLRSLFFLVANLVDRFYLLKYGLAIILTFIGVKMLITDWVHIPIFFALSIVAITLSCSVALSIIMPARK